MLCKKDQQQENRNIDDLPPLHDVEEPLNNDTGNLYIGWIPWESEHAYFNTPDASWNALKG